MKKLLSLSILISILVIALIAIVSATPGNGNGNSGSIWTTRNDCGDEQQDVNEYAPGEHVYINAKNFDSDTEYSWEIKGQPGEASCDPNVIMASGSTTTDNNGAVCFDAYTVQEGDCGVYKVDFNNKHDNYHVIPEFGLFIGVLTIISAVGVFFFVRRR